MDRPYDDSETLGMTDVDDGTPIPPGMGANGASSMNKSGKAKTSDGPPSKRDTFASGDQAAAQAEPNWADEITVFARRQPILAAAVAAGVGLLAGLLISR